MLGCQFGITMADLAQHGLHDVGDVDQVGKAKGSGPALDRMRNAKDRIDFLGVRVLHIEGQQ